MAITNTNYREMVQDALQNHSDGSASFNDIKTYIFTNYQVKRGFANWVEQMLKQMVEKGEVKQSDGDEYSLSKLPSSTKKTTLEVCGLRRRRRRYRSKRRSKSRRRRRRRSTKSRGRSRTRRRRRRLRSGSRKGKRRSASRARGRRVRRVGRRRKRYSRRGKRSGRRRYKKRRTSRRRFRKRRGACCNVTKKNVTPLAERKAAKLAAKKIKICTKGKGSK